MTEKLTVLDDGSDAIDLSAEHAELRAQFLGFGDADELKEWGEQAERDRLAEEALRKGAKQ